MRRAGRWVFGGLLAAHLLALYWPRVDLAGMPPDSDKLGHALLFGLPALAALLTLARRWAGVAVGALTVHAPVSEWLQAAVLPSRSGDPRDAVADLVGSKGARRRADRIGRFAGVPRPHHGRDVQRLRLV